MSVICQHTCRDCKAKVIGITVQPCGVATDIEMERLVAAIMEAQKRVKRVKPVKRRRTETSDEDTEEDIEEVTTTSRKARRARDDVSESDSESDSESESEDDVIALNVSEDSDGDKSLGEFDDYKRIDWEWVSDDEDVSINEPKKVAAKKSKNEDKSRYTMRSRDNGFSEFAHLYREVDTDWNAVWKTTYGKKARARIDSVLFSFGLESVAQRKRVSAILKALEENRITMQDTGHYKENSKCGACGLQHKETRYDLCISGEETQRVGAFCAIKLSPLCALFRELHSSYSTQASIERRLDALDASLSEFAAANEEYRASRGEKI